MLINTDFDLRRTVTMPKVLVVDDDQSIRAKVVELLTLEDYQVLEAENGLMGVWLVQIELPELPDLIISDIMMPRMDGLKMFELLRLQTDTVDIPFIFLTARAEQPLIYDAIAKGARHYLRKPFTTTALLKVVRNALS
jgi:two-component system sensor histidine kinase/response regulator